MIKSNTWRLHPKTIKQGMGMLEVTWLSVELREWFAARRSTFPFFHSFSFTYVTFFNTCHFWFYILIFTYVYEQLTGINIAFFRGTYKGNQEIYFGMESVSLNIKAQGWILHHTIMESFCLKVISLSYTIYGWQLPCGF